MDQCRHLDTVQSEFTSYSQFDLVLPETQPGPKQTFESWHFLFNYRESLYRVGCGDCSIFVYDCTGTREDRHVVAEVAVWGTVVVTVV